MQYNTKKSHFASSVVKFKNSKFSKCKNSKNTFTINIIHSDFSIIKRASIEVLVFSMAFI